MSKAVVLALVAACSGNAPIDVETAPAEVATVELPSTLTCGTTAPALSMLYVGNHNTLQTACQGDGETVLVLNVGGEFPIDVAELAARHRVVVPDLRGYDLGVIEHLDEYVQDLVMLIRKTSTRPVIVIGHDAGGEALARLLAERHPEVIDAERARRLHVTYVRNVNAGRRPRSGWTCGVATRPATC